MSHDPETSSDPFLSLDGARNFRDAGGRAIGGGLQLRRGMLFRSGQLSALTAADHAMLAPIGIRDIHDLRQGAERERLPTRWEGALVHPATERDHLPVWHEILTTGYSLDRDGATGFMRDLYSRLPFDFAPRIAMIARRMAETGSPCVVHCSAGKDRTGVVVAVLLALAGAPFTLIETDYMLTADRANLSRDQKQAFAAGQRARVRPISAEMHAVLLSVDRAFLASSFAAIERTSGTFADYVRRDLGLDDSEVAAFREVMLAPDA